MEGTLDPEIGFCFGHNGTTIYLYTTLASWSIKDAYKSNNY